MDEPRPSVRLLSEMVEESVRRYNPLASMTYTDQTSSALPSSRRTVDLSGMGGEVSLLDADWMSSYRPERPSTSVNQLLPSHLRQLPAQPQAQPESAPAKSGQGESSTRKSLPLREPRRQRASLAWAAIEQYGVDPATLNWHKTQPTSLEDRQSEKYMLSQLKQQLEASIQKQRDHQGAAKTNAKGEQDEQWNICQEFQQKLRIQDTVSSGSGSGTGTGTGTGSSSSCVSPANLLKVPSSYQSFSPYTQSTWWRDPAAPRPTFQQDGQDNVTSALVSKEDKKSDVPSAQALDGDEDMRDDMVDDDEGEEDAPSMRSRLTNVLSELVITAHQNLFGKTTDEEQKEGDITKEGIVLVRHRPRPANRDVERVKDEANASGGAKLDADRIVTREDLLETVILDPETYREMDKDLVVVPREEFVVVEQDLHY